jgi:hypothetical protein
VDAPPELLHWARDTINGITSLVGKARRGELRIEDDDMAMLRRHEQDLFELIERNKSTDPAKWVNPE